MDTVKKALIIGAFSDIGKNSTFGDIQAMEVLCSWLNEIEIKFDVLDNVTSNKKNISINEIDPYKYDILIYVCGPFGRNTYCKKFSHCLKIGIDISIEKDESHYIDSQTCLNLIIPRDSKTIRNPEFAFKASSRDVAVVGVALVHGQGKKENSKHEEVEAAVKKYFKSNGYAVIKLDTLITTPIRKNQTNISSVSQFEALVRRCDFIISSRLHGLVYALKNNVPVIAIDPILGGGKLTKQTEAVNWPIILNGEDISAEKIENAEKEILKIKNTDTIYKVKEFANKRLDEIKHSLINNIIEFKNKG
jgi:hypothetical protein